MAEPIAIRVPKETVSDETVLVINWLVPNGAFVTQDEPLVEVETSKALLEIQATSAGYLWQCYKAGDEVAVGAPICFITDNVQSPLLNDSECDHTVEPVSEVAASAPARLTLQARQMAKELGIDINTFQNGSLIRSRDLLVRSSQPTPDKPCPSATQPAAPAVAGLALQWENLPKRKTAEARRLANGQTATVSSFVTMPCSLAQQRANFAAHKAEVSFSAFLIFEVARLLRKYPVFNSVYWQGKIGLYEKVNIGWALDDGEGLVVPVIFDADDKTLDDIQAEMERHSAAYVRQRLSAKDLAGATFTISDLSGKGVSMFMPLISEGQSSILGIGVDLLTLAFDHQLAEGHTAARFLKELSARLSEYNQTANENKRQQSELSCAYCGSGVSELQANKSFLLVCQTPARAYVCSLCLTNY
ncbi:MAG: 2-oxo acid dehydrogenase subunit E2 [Acidobacteria bacterium]|nr:2-oxo acid dehydrogenase subunit E2 [Acidobacteriota bacterium]